MHALIQLIDYAIAHKLITPLDYDYAFNRLCRLLNIAPDYVPYQHRPVEASIDSLLKPLLDAAAQQGLIVPDTLHMRDCFEAEMMDIFTPAPSFLQAEFDALLTKDTKAASSRFYERSVHANYIKMQRIKKNKVYTVKTEYGDIVMAINKAKPEKDPKDIVKKEVNTHYPACLLCKENVGFYGHASHPGRTQHRMIKLALNQEPFYLQFSPYVYFDEHLIVIHEEHIPMQISAATFKRLFDFVDLFPHYFLGSNAGLPIVGGSILSHEHYQGGKATFPIEKAAAFYQTTYGSIHFEALKWPISVLRLSSESQDELFDVAEQLRQFYTGYSDPSVSLIAHTGTTEHNAINPILRKEDGVYHLYIALRNNRTTQEFEDGLFHPHPSRHHIKKENIGLIEVMGMAILPGRLETEFTDIVNALKSGTIDASLGAHEAWAQTLKAKNVKTLDAIEQEAGHVFTSGLEDCGVFKQTLEGQTAFKAFVQSFLNTLN
jgi:UDPglucose--hexose-1-phosphate uridylyltransferase